jgi:hypothetical protein
MDAHYFLNQIRKLRPHPEQNISLRHLCKNFWLEETAILDMQMSKLLMISGYVEYMPAMRSS